MKIQNQERYSLEERAGFLKTPAIQGQYNWFVSGEIDIEA
jgi:hypothetical protein